MVVNKVTFTRLFAEAWERSMTPKNVRTGFRVTGICPFSPGCLPEMAFATCFQEVSVAVSVPAPTELDVSGELQHVVLMSHYHLVLMTHNHLVRVR